MNNVEEFETVGISNIVYPNKMFRVLQLDYDTKDYSYVFSKITEIRDEYKLNYTVITKTGKGFHVHFVDIMTLEEWKEALIMSKCDDKFITAGLKHKYTVLRITHKRHIKTKEITSKEPIFYCKIDDRKQKRPISLAHHRFLTSYYDIEDNKQRIHLPGSEKLKFVYYRTAQE